MPTPKLFFVLGPIGRLGAGTGILGLGVSAALGAHAEVVVVSDPAVPIGGGLTTLDVLKRTLSANAASAPSAVACRLLWGDADDVSALRAAYGSFDVVIGCELLYREDSVAALVQTVRELDDVAAVVLAQETRPAGMAIEQTCVALMREAGYAVTQAPVANTPAVIYTFTRARTVSAA